MDELSVFHEDRLVGTLARTPAGPMQFRYSDEWLEGANRFPISIRLPLAKTTYGEEAHAFFANLLPEGTVRLALCKKLGISPDNDFALLEAIGGDCAGALSISRRRQERKKEEYDELSTERLAHLAAEGGVLAALDGQSGIRLSLAGAQDKLPVRLDGDRVLLPKGGAASTHLLKFDSPMFKHLAANEVLTTLLARELGLGVVRVDLRRFGRRSVAVVERYDREVSSSGKIRRIHQEDFCQALAVRPSQKYEAEGGPAFADCDRLLARVSARPLEDRRSLFRWLCFNALVFNADGHAKNLSLLFDGSAPRLAPFYDLVCTRAYPRVEGRLAMTVGGEADPTLLRRRHWERLADATGVGARFVVDTVRDLAEAMPQAVAGAREEFRSRWGDSPVLQLVLPKLPRQAKRILQQLKE